MCGYAKRNRDDPVGFKGKVLVNLLINHAAALENLLDQMCGCEKRDREENR